jgi:hypothetical protein
MKLFKRKGYYECKHCSYILRKEDAIVSARACCLKDFLCLATFSRQPLTGHSTVVPVTFIVFFNSFKPNIHHPTWMFNSVTSTYDFKFHLSVTYRQLKVILCLRLFWVVGLRGRVTCLRWCLRSGFGVWGAVSVFERFAWPFAFGLYGFGL